MHNFILFLKEFRIPKKEELFGALASFSKRRFSIFLILVITAFVSMLFIVERLNTAMMTDVPAKGGEISEGIVGSPSLVNPVLAVSDADKDMTTLVYSGLMRKTQSGAFIPDLAESYTVSADGTVYTFILKKDIKFHDGASITADDVVFTIEKIQDPLIKSPRKFSWDGVTASKEDSRTVVFTLKQPYISFMDNTTIGILPAKIWRNISPAEFSLSQYNIKAVGSGPYQIVSVKKDKDGIPVEYDLKSFKKFALGEPNINSVKILSYANEKEIIKALASHSIDQAGGLSPENASTLEKSGYMVNTGTLPRIFGLFLNNTTNKIFNDKQVIKALDLAIDRDRIVEQVLEGYGVAIHSPIPQTIITDSANEKYRKASTEEANKILEEAGWIINEEDGIRQKKGAKNEPSTRLVFSISTGDTPELKEAALLIKEQLAKIGVEVDVNKVYETGQLNQLIRARDYEALFFGQIVNHESDLFSFWHSSQKSDPGLNIAMYNNKAVDIILENTQKILKFEDRLDSYKDLLKEFNKDIPAILIYSPKYLYATLPKVSNAELETITVPSDRFTSVYNWYANKDHVWKIFNR